MLRRAGGQACKAVAIALNNTVCSKRMTLELAESISGTLKHRSSFFVELQEVDLCYPNL